MTEHIDPGDQDHGRKKRRGLAHAKHADQPTLFGGPTPAPANSGPSTKRWDPDTSRHAAERASENMTAKQTAVLSMFHRFGPMTDEELVDNYERVRRDLAGEARNMVPEQAPSGLRTRRFEITELNYLEYAGFKRLMKTGGMAKVHRVKKGP